MGILDSEKFPLLLYSGLSTLASGAPSSSARLRWLLPARGKCRAAPSARTAAAKTQPPPRTLPGHTASAAGALHKRKAGTGERTERKRGSGQTGGRHRLQHPPLESARQSKPRACQEQASPAGHGQTRALLTACAVVTGQPVWHGSLVTLAAPASGLRRCLPAAISSAHAGSDLRVSNHAKWQIKIRRCPSHR